jgi:colicin import membrane protein
LPSRRSQNEALEGPLTPSRISSRSKRSSDKAQADAATKARRDAATKARAEAAAQAVAKPAATAGAAANANCPRDSRGHIIGNFKAARKAREAHQAELQRKAAAADRVRAQLERQERDKSAEVSQIDEIEAQRLPQDLRRSSWNLAPLG